jgi:sulfoxide reductase catalytic subunit YedY
MEKRRHFLKTTFGFITSLGILVSPFFQAVRMVYGKTKKIILPKDIDRDGLRRRNPALLDTRNLEPTPLKDFQIMGDSSYGVNINTWRLEVAGRVKKPLNLSYSQISDLPSFERNVLLICPGFFANHGRWKGISLAPLIEQAQMKNDVTHVTFSASSDVGDNEESFPIADVVSDRVFLAHGVNGQPLPMKHGFPLRVVAEGYYGSFWVKYVTRVSLDLQ